MPKQYSINNLKTIILIFLNILNTYLLRVSIGTYNPMATCFLSIHTCQHRWTCPIILVMYSRIIC